ncbi:hypothetical protein BDY21DRAFT_343459 [Lineolata rhizophorae]|uniref:Uncharacterized protein n=1 Tax=Lineolata rhizophorae TaxID=578093 RepID=A0A6A6P2M6_9PEZI|nr:hypothetical protein BDY21DRAFT_343459 [Lineolata rhizophorae]
MVRSESEGRDEAEDLRSREAIGAAAAESTASSGDEGPGSLMPWRDDALKPSRSPRRSSTSSSAAVEGPRWAEPRTDWARRPVWRDGGRPMGFLKTPSWLTEARGPGADDLDSVPPAGLVAPAPGPVEDGVRPRTELSEGFLFRPNEVCEGCLRSRSDDAAGRTLGC